MLINLHIKKIVYGGECSVNIGVVLEKIICQSNNSPFVPRVIFFRFIIIYLYD